MKTQFVTYVFIGLLLFPCIRGGVDDSLINSVEQHCQPEQRETNTDAYYLLWCPCMGRFGNQLDHFLSAIDLAERLNRTLVAPPLIEYKGGNVELLPIDSIFRMDYLQMNGRRVVTLEHFVSELVATAWPKPRVAHCFAAGRSDPDCVPPSANPFLPFWNAATGNSGFEGSAPASIDYRSPQDDWNAAWPMHRYNTIALTSAPGEFPAKDSKVKSLQSLLVWTESRMEAARSRAAEWFDNKNWVGVHIRAGPDWQKACNFGIGRSQFFASPQCSLPGGVVTQDVCLPSVDQVVSQLLSTIAKIDAVGVFIGTDSPLAYDNILETLMTRLNGRTLEIRKLDNSEPLDDLVLFSIATHFIGNCVSSFTAISVRERSVVGRSYSFWGIA